ncbi:hypothetical protein LR48_Vigan02g210300 [Vigna angularis]|uniref:SLH domain-containing protein n=3 Tax=Phaseolus angularis TaxID=3914 RepID=A0A0L9TZF9_PHAAN|nr:uncharacterized protein LOC108324029 isoform X1 [Vigna angularis]KOM35953.1 hypothetical protein LR48_Vigan02g210300 [Vigna angularis]BAT94230.1 hypothetical protein VIGAN_08081400 [Vigna angularis var. angularis]
MASITTPNSLQIRLAFTPFNSTKINPILFHTRFTNFDRRRVRLLCIANHENGSGSVPIRSGSDNRSVSEFKKNESYGGVVGVGVAGIFLLSGIAFAAFLVSRRNGARQVKPLTTHQGVLLSSDDCNDKTENVNADNRVEQVDINVEGQIDISRGCLSPESDKIPNCHRIVNDSDIESQWVRDIHNIDDNADAIIYISVQEELQHGSVVDDRYVVPREGTVALNDPEPETPIDSLDSYRFKDFDSSSTVDTDNSTTELKENPSFIEPRNMSNIDAEPLPVICEQQDEIIVSSGNRSSAIFNTLSFVADDESVPVNIDVSTQSNKTTSDPEVFLEEDDPSLSTKGNLDLNNMPQVSDKSSFEEQNFSEDDLLAKSFVSSTNTFLDGQVKNDDNEVNKSRSESSNSGAFYSAPGIPAPSVVSSAVEVFPGKVLVPAVVDQGQGQALAALQALKIIESDVEPSDLCTRREYARWLVSASSALSRKTISKVFPAMYIENVTELAFDDITSEDPDFSSIQGLAEAGLIESRLSRCNGQLVTDEHDGPFYFSPESPLSRQDLVCWKTVLEKRQLPEADGKMLYQLSGFIDAGKVHSDAFPALVADVSAGEHGITALAFGYTRLFQPHKPVTKAQAAVALAAGDAFDIVNRELARVEAESLADNAVASHSVLVAQVEKDINASFEQKLSIEREKINVVERLTIEATCELERLRAEREEDRISFIKERAAIDSERVIFSRLRLETEDHLQNLMCDKVEIAHEKERISKLRELAENEEKEIKRVQYELEVERNALSMARAWVEDEAKRVSAYAVALERARDRWERNGIEAVDDNFLEDSTGVPVLNLEEQLSVQDTVDRGENLLQKLKKMAADVGRRARDMIDEIILIISQFVSRLKEWTSKSGKQAEELRETLMAKAGKSVHEVHQGTAEFGFTIKNGAKRVAGDCIQRVEKLTQNFRT